METISVDCTTCNQSYSLNVRAIDYEEWMAGEYIQNAMPYLSVDQRELLISGTCGPCFNKMFV